MVTPPCRFILEIGVHGFIRLKVLERVGERFDGFFFSGILKQQPGNHAPCIGRDANSTPRHGESVYADHCMAEGELGL